MGKDYLLITSGNSKVEKLKEIVGYVRDELCKRKSGVHCIEDSGYSCILQLEDSDIDIVCGTYKVIDSKCAGGRKSWYAMVKRFSYPELIEMDEKVVIDFYRSGRGPGGQNVNKVSTACRVRCGSFVASSDKHRTQYRNKMEALDLLSLQLSYKNEEILSLFKKKLQSMKTVIERGNEVVIMEK